MLIFYMRGVVKTANKLKLAVEKVIYLLAFGTTGCVRHAHNMNY